MAAQPARPPYPPPASRVPFPVRLKRYWHRVSEGMKLNELWHQLRSDARSTYRLYSREIDATRPAGVTRFKHAFAVARQFFWAILEKLTPARRILLLVALVLLVLPRASVAGNPDGGWQFLGGLLMFWSCCWNSPIAWS